MKIREIVLDKIESTKTGKRLIREQRYRMIFGASVSFSINLFYAFYNGGLGIINHSLWFITMCAYYIILSTIRFSIILCEHKNRTAVSKDMEHFVMKLSGVLIMALSILLTGIIYISLSENIAVKHENILMITIATYTFYKITMAIIRAIKQHKNQSSLLTAVCNIGYVDVAVSVLTLQRSMLVSFGKMIANKAHTMNVLTGAGVCIFVLILGISMFIKAGGKKYGKIKTCKGK